MTTVYIDELKPGLSASTSRIVTEHQIQLFGEATGDMNPVHFDEEYARKTIFRGRVAHGALTIGFLSALVGTRLPGAGTIFVSATIAFKAPVRIGDTVVVTCTVTGVEGRHVMINCICRVGETVVLESDIKVLAPKRPSSKVGSGG
ncbi:MAG TPA: MaoC family dehydratase [Rhizomicrobium sp.]|nr:MaoC family dehydratase [Rhizomicrobium sp.]